MQCWSVGWHLFGYAYRCATSQARRHSWSVAKAPHRHIGSATANEQSSCCQSVLAFPSKGQRKRCKVEEWRMRDTVCWSTYNSLSRKEKSVFVTESWSSEWGRELCRVHDVLFRKMPSAWLCLIDKSRWKKKMRCSEGVHWHYSVLHTRHFSLTFRTVYFFR